MNSCISDRKEKPIDWVFILESLLRAKWSYEEKALKYLYPNGIKDEEYNKQIYLPKLLQFTDAIEAITKIRKGEVKNKQ